MNLPNYLKNPDIKVATQENYHEEVNQTLQQNLGPNGWFVTNITNADLTTTPILDPNLGTFTTVMDAAPVGALWFVTDSSPPAWVGKQAAGPTALVKFTVTDYP